MNNLINLEDHEPTKSLKEMDSNQQRLHFENELINLNSAENENLILLNCENISDQCDMPDEKGNSCTSDQHKVSEASTIAKPSNERNSEIASNQNHSSEVLIDFEDHLTTGLPDILDENLKQLNAISEKNLSSKGIKNRLLKLTLSNALVQSPLSRKCSLEEGSSPEFSIFNEAAKLANQLSELNGNLLSSSPKTGDDTFDDLMDTNPNWIDSESDISKDLEMMKIPMLEKIEQDLKRDEASVIKQQDSPGLLDSNTIQTHADALNKTKTQNSYDINMIKNKLNSYKLKSHLSEDSEESNENIDVLISKIKEKLGCYSECKIKKAKILLDSLSRLLNDDDGKVESTANNNIQETKEALKKNRIHVEALPHASKKIIRQGTFDLDLEDDISKQDNSLNQAMRQHNIVAEDMNFELGTQEKLLTVPNDSNLNEIVQQLGKIVGGTEGVNILQSNSNPSASSNPTYIVLMATPGKNVLNNISCDNSVTPAKNDFRRRSCSLTLPNKKKIESQNKIKEVANKIKTGNSIKTPNRNVLSRRNSISSSTPNSNLSARRSIYNNLSSSFTADKKPEIGSNQNNGTSLNNNEIPTKLQTKRMIPLKAETAANLKLKCNEKIKSKGPLRATFQLNLPTTVERNSPVTPDGKIDNKRRSMYSNQTLSINKSDIIKRPPMACSTPMNISPKRSPSTIKTNKFRLSTTPNTKSSHYLNESNTLQLRRKSFSDTVSKQNEENIHLAVTRNMKTPHQIPKFINKIKSPSTRPQISVSNKEN